MKLTTGLSLKLHDDLAAINRYADEGNAELLKLLVITALNRMADMQAELDDFIIAHGLNITGKVSTLKSAY